MKERVNLGVIYKEALKKIKDIESPDWRDINRVIKKVCKDHGYIVTKIEKSIIKEYIVQTLRENKQK